MRIHEQYSVTIHSHLIYQKLLMYYQEKKPQSKCIWVPVKTPLCLSLCLFTRLSLDVTHSPVVRTRADGTRPVWSHLLEGKTQVIQSRCVQCVTRVGVFHHCFSHTFLVLKKSLHKEALKKCTSLPTHLLSMHVICPQLWATFALKSYSWRLLLISFKHNHPLLPLQSFFFYKNSFYIQEFLCVVLCLFI